MQEKASQWLAVKKNRVYFLTLLNGFFSLKTILIEEILIHNSLKILVI